MMDKQTEQFKEFHLLVQEKHIMFHIMELGTEDLRHHLKQKPKITVGETCHDFVGHHKAAVLLCFCRSPGSGSPSLNPPHVLLLRLSHTVE